MNFKESELQQACVLWFKYQYPKEVLFAIPNGGERSQLTRQILSAEGVMNGVCDLFLMRAMQGFNGLFIEMKYANGKPTVYQETFMKLAIERNYKCVVCNSSDLFRQTIENYLGKR